LEVSASPAKVRTPEKVPVLKRAVVVAEQGSMGFEEVKQLGKAAGRDAVAAADARAFLEVDGLDEAVLDEHFVRDLERLLEVTGRPKRCPPISRKTWLGDSSFEPRTNPVRIIERVRDWP
jgi:hypothetical protein